MRPSLYPARAQYLPITATKSRCSGNEVVPWNHHITKNKIRQIIAQYVGQHFCQNLGQQIGHYDYLLTTVKKRMVRTHEHIGKADDALIGVDLGNVQRCSPRTIHGGCGTKQHRTANNITEKA